MAIINNSHKFVFVHIPKSAGTSISIFLSKLTNYCDLELGGTVFGEEIQGPYARRFGLSKHSPASKLRAAMGQALWSRYFTFAFVRNPFHRAYSSYRFLKKWTDYDEALRLRIACLDTFKAFVMSDVFEGPGPDNILRPQTFWLRRGLSSPELIIDFVGRVENLAGDMRTILQTIGLEKHADMTDDLPHANASGEPDPAAFADADVVERITTRYSVDFKQLGYAPETPPTS